MVTTRPWRSKLSTTQCGNAAMPILAATICINSNVLSTLFSCGLIPAGCRK
ncbi:hypothetical protein ACP3P6_03210 [Enterobacter mori]